MNISFLDNFRNRCNESSEKIIKHEKYITSDRSGFPEPNPGYGSVENQDILFHKDFKRHIKNLSVHTRYELLILAQNIATLVLSPFAIFIDI